MSNIFNVLLYVLLAITSLFLICLVLIQRGKGGGLAGAFGGAGGSSAFGTKAGDVFTRVTMISAGIWIALNMLLVVMSNRRPSAWSTSIPGASKPEFIPSKAGDGKDATKPGAALDQLPNAKGTVPTGTPVPLPASKGTPDASLLLPTGPSTPKTAPVPAPTTRP